MDDQREQTEPHAPSNTAPVLGPLRRAPLSLGSAGLVQEAVGGYGARAEEPIPSSAKLVRAVARFKWTAAIVFVSGSTILLTGIWMLMVPKYRASALLLVEPMMARLLDRTEDTGLIPMYRQYRQSQASLVTSSVVIDRVLDRTEVRVTDWFKAAPQSLFDHLRSVKPPRDRLREDLVVTVPRNTYLLEISLSAYKPGEAKVIVAAVAQEFLNYSLQTRGDADKQLRGPLDKLKNQFDADVAKHERISALYEKELQNRTPDAALERRRQKLENYQVRLQAIAVTKKKAEQLAQVLSDETATSQPSLLGYDLDAEWQRRSEALERAKLELDVVRDSLGDSNPAVRKPKRELEYAEKMLRRRERQLDQEASLGITQAEPITTNSLRQQIIELDSEEKSLQEEVERAQGEYEALFRTAQELAQTRKKLLFAERQQERVLRRIFELDQKRELPATIQMIGDAVESSAPQKDKRFSRSLIALVGAAFAAVVATILRQRMSARILEASEARTGTSPPVLLGHLSAHPPNSSLPIEECGIQLESMRVIRTALLSRLKDSDSPIVQITSAGPGAGKTTFTVMLGKSLAKCGKRVLLVDGDLRKPALAERLGVAACPGLHEVLNQSATEELAIQQTDQPGLSVLPAGTAARNEDTEAITNGMFCRLLKRWRERYDIVLLDSCPIMSGADAVILGEHAEGTIMIVREGHCTRTGVLQALLRLNNCHATLIGTVFVGSQRSIGYGYPYYGDAAAP